MFFFFLYDVDVLQYISFSALKFSLPFFFLSLCLCLSLCLVVSLLLSAYVCVCLSVCLPLFCVSSYIFSFTFLSNHLFLCLYVFFFMFCPSLWLSLYVCFCLPICQSVSICLYLKSGFKCVFYNSPSNTHSLHTSPIITPCSRQIHI